MFRSEPLKDCQLKLFAAFVVTVGVAVASPLLLVLELLLLPVLSVEDKQPSMADLRQ